MGFQHIKNLCGVSTEQLAAIVIPLVATAKRSGEGKRLVPGEWTRIAKVVREVTGSDVTAKQLSGFHRHYNPPQRTIPFPEVREATRAAPEGKSTVRFQQPPTPDKRLPTMLMISADVVADLRRAHAQFVHRVQWMMPPDANGPSVDAFADRLLRTVLDLLWANGQQQDPVLPLGDR